MAATSAVCNVMFRVVLPLCLLCATIFRFNGLSFVYGLLLLISALLPGPTYQTMASHTGRYLRTVTALSCLFGIAQLVFHVTLLCMPPYSQHLPNCTRAEKIVRQIGFQRLNGATVIEALRQLMPDIGMIVISILTFVLCSKVPVPDVNDLSDSSNEIAATKTQRIRRPSASHMVAIYLGELFVVLMLVIAGVIYPSVLSSVYFLSFLGIATWWSCYKSLGCRFSYVRVIIMVYTGLHLLLIYLYQFEFFQEALDHESLPARLLGLTTLVDFSCTSPLSFDFAQNSWPAFVNPFCLLISYWLLATETRWWTRIPIPEDVPDSSTEVVYSIRPKPLIKRRYAGRARDGVEYEKLIDSERPGKQYQSVARSSPGADAETEPTSQAPDDVRSGQEKEEAGIRSALSSILLFLTRQSYIATLILMMVWSITYHSWLAFVLLLWACFIWFTPNSRKWCLRMSPGIVLYAEALLIIQFIYGLNLNDDELPLEKGEVSLREIGFEKYQYPCLVLFVKILITLMFCATMRQYMRESKFERHRKSMADLHAVDIALTVGSRNRGTFAEVEDELLGTTDNLSVTRLGYFLLYLITKYWIFVCMAMLLLMSINRYVVLYRIVYMILFLIFILTFQISFRIWKAVMLAFWIIVVFYSMVVLILIYTYQFDKFPQYWHNFTGWSDEQIRDIGLEHYETKELFLNLLTPTSFLIVIILQIHFFHDAFCKIITSSYKPRKVRQRASMYPSGTSPSHKLVSSATEAEDGEIEDTHPEEKEGSAESGETFTKDLNAGWMVLLRAWHWTVDIAWRLLEIHMMKIVVFTVIMVSMNEVVAVNIPFVFVAVVFLMLRPLQQFLCHCYALWISILIITKMIFQLQQINSTAMDYNCTSSAVFNETINMGEWIGLEKTKEIDFYLKGYIASIIILSLQAIVRHRQHHMLYVLKIPSSPEGVVFRDITRERADDNLVSCVKYVINYCFYKFGLEICFVMTAITVTVRMDIYSVVYLICLGIFLFVNRPIVRMLWPIYVIFLGILLPIEYCLCVGLPKFLCIEYPWADNSTGSTMEPALREWLYLPDYHEPIRATVLIADFFQFLFAVQQWAVFRIEKTSTAYAGGDNSKISHRPQNNPTNDFVGTGKYLDSCKEFVFMYVYWIVLAILFLAGTSRVSLYCMGYVLFCFLFLWFGNEFFLKPMQIIRRMWNIILIYNFCVMLIKTCMEVIGCVYFTNLYENFCWLVQLLSIACLRSSYDITDDPAIAAKCTVPKQQAGLMWDCICFAFLLLQRRIFYSYYFQHVVAELKAQTALASRGAELINGILIREYAEQQQLEYEVVIKIKQKMDRIRKYQLKVSKYKVDEPETHFEDADDSRSKFSGLSPQNGDHDAIRAGDYYMFEEDEEMDAALTELDEGSELFSPAAEASEHKSNVLMLIDQAMKSSSFHDAVRRVKAGRTSRHDSASSELSHVSAASDLAKIGSPKTIHFPETDPGAGPSSHVDQSPVLPEESLRKSTLTEVELDDEVFEAKLEKQPSTWSKFRSMLEFFWLFLCGIMDSVSAVLNHSSKDYRYVAEVLRLEKMKLKEVHRFSYYNLSMAARKSILAGESMDKEAKKEGSEERPHDGDVIVHIDGSERPDPPTWLALKQASISMQEEPEPSAIRLLRAIYHALISHSELLCYFIIVLNQLSNASIISLPLPLLVFFWGTLSVPRPTKSFWITVITYVEAIVVVKYIFQFGFYKWNDDADYSPFWPPRILGIEKRDNYAVWDLVTLLALFFHRSILKSLGLWKNTTEESAPKSTEQTTTEALEHSEALTTPDHDPNKPADETKAIMESPADETKAIVESPANVESDGTFKTASDEPQPPETADKDAPRGKHKESASSDVGDIVELQPNENGSMDLRNLEGPEEENLEEEEEEEPPEEPPGYTLYLKPFKQFFDHLLRPVYQLTADVFVFMFFCDFIAFLIVVFGYSAFGSATGGTASDVASYIQENKVPVPFLIMLIAQFALIIVDRAIFLRKNIMAKLIFQYILVVVVHLWMFFILPAVTDRLFIDNVPAQLWYFVKCVYFVLSAYQIRAGYPTRILGNFLTKSYNYINLIAFKIFLLIPFVLEMRALMDWMWTDTTLTLFNWLKMEDIYSNIFCLKCYRRAEAAYPTPRGERRGGGLKYLMGGGMLFLIIFFIWFPLVLFSLGNVVGVHSPPIDCTVQIQIGGYEPIFKMSAQDQNLFEFDEYSYEKQVVEPLRKSKQKYALSFVEQYEPVDVVEVIIDGNSTSVWPSSPPSKEALIQELAYSGSNMRMRFTYSFTRSMEGGTAAPVVQSENIIKLVPNDTIRIGLANLLNGSQADPVYVPHMYPKYLQVMTDKVRPASQLLPSGEANYTSVLLALDFDNQGHEWWTIREVLPNNDTSGHLTLIAFFDKVYPSTLSFLAGYGIIGLYISLVLVVSRFVRMFMSGLAYRIMFEELPNVDRVLQLCLDIYLVRESKEYQLEEDLFSRLIFLYRSPETLIKWSKPKTR